MKNLKFICCASACLLLILFWRDAAEAARKGYDVFISSVFPALMPFFILTSLLQTSGVPKRPSMGVLFIMSFISGAPCAAKMIQALEMDIDTRTRLCAAMNTVSPMFVIGVLASNILGEASLSIPIITSQLVSALIMIITIKRQRIKEVKSVYTEPLSLPQAVFTAMNSMLSLCGTIIIFMVLLSIIRATGAVTLLTYPLEKMLSLKHEGLTSTIITGILEMTNGCISLTELYPRPPMRLAAALGAFFVTFGGICIFVQSTAFVKLKSGMYLLLKFIQGIIAALIAYLLTPLFFNDSIAVFSPVSGERLVENTTSMGAAFAASMLGISVILLLGSAIRRKKR